MDPHQTVKQELYDNYMDVKVEDHPIKVENNMEIGFRKTSPAKIEPLQIVKHEFNQLVDNRQCDKSFNFRGDLVKHQRMHNGKKPYQCNQYDKYFSEKGLLFPERSSSKTPTNAYW